MDMRKIGVFGDSFGYQKKNEPYASWVDLLANYATVDNHSECGVSEYKILKQLERADLDQYDDIIVTHTSYSRVFVEYNPLHADSEYHQNCDMLYADIEAHKDEFSRAGQLYFKHIYSEDYARDIHNLILKEIVALLAGRRVVHMTHFDYEGLYPLPNLLEFYSLFINNRGPVNHYNERGNQEVFDQVLKRLQ
jgi:hypothetical protein